MSYYQENRERVLKYQKEYRFKNLEKIKQREKEYRKRNKERIRKYYKENINKCRENRKKYVARIRMETLCHYGGNPPVCACCGEFHLEFLTIDHVGGGGTKHRQEIGRENIYIWLKRNSYPQGFRILCMNCNLSYGLYGYCPHKCKNNTET